MAHLNDKAEYFDYHVSAFMGEMSETEVALLDWFRRKWNIRPGMSVLEPGCGTGALTRRLAEWTGPSGVVVAFDISPKMLAAHAQNAPMDNVRRLLSSAEQLPDMDERFDCVVCYRAFPHFDDPVRALRNFHGLLRSNGEVHVSHPVSRQRVNEIHSDAGGAVADDILEGESRMREFFTDAGFRVQGLLDLPDRYNLTAVRIDEAQEKAQ